MAAAWGITGGSAGMAAQVMALAEALGVEVQMKQAQVSAPFVWLPNRCFAGLLDRFVLPHMLACGSDALMPPWPQLVISCGRRGAIAALGLRRQLSRQKNDESASCHPSSVIRHPYFIHIQDPHVPPQYFDLIVAMEHDKITGTNVLKTRFALHKITPDALAAARTRFATWFSMYDAPYIAVLLGGSTNKYTLTAARMKKVIADLQELLDRSPGSLLITPSRRTGADNIAMLRAAFAGNSRVYIYNFASENPYMGLLALADALVVSNDSVNMMSDAYATGKPLYILPLEGHQNTKPARFAEMLVDDGIARRCDGRVEQWAYPVRNEMAWLAEQIKQRFSFSL